MTEKKFRFFNTRHAKKFYHQNSIHCELSEDGHTIVTDSRPLVRRLSRMEGVCELSEMKPAVKK